MFSKLKVPVNCCLMFLLFVCVLPCVVFLNRRHNKVPVSAGLYTGWQWDPDLPTGGKTSDGWSTTYLSRFLFLIFFFFPFISLLFLSFPYFPDQFIGDSLNNFYISLHKTAYWNYFRLLTIYPNTSLISFHACQMLMQNN